MVTHRIWAHYALPLRWLPKSSLQGEPKINNFRGVQLLHPIFEPNRALVTTKTSLITHNSLKFEREICSERQIYFDWFLCSLLIIYKPNLPDSRRSQHIAFKDMAVQCYASINHSEICSNRRNSWRHLVLASVYITSYQRHDRRMVIWNVVKKVGRFNHECVLLMKMTTKSSATKSKCILLWYCVFVLIILKKNYRRMVLKWRKAWYQTSMHTYIINCWNLYLIHHYYFFVIVGFSAFCVALPFMFRIFRMVIHEFCIIYSSIFNVLLTFED